MRKLENLKTRKLENQNIGNFKFSNFPIFKFSSPRRSAVRGAVMMEYVIVGVLIAVACIFAVVAFSRTIARGWGVSARGATLNTKEALERQKMNQSATDEEGKTAADFHDSMHE